MSDMQEYLVTEELEHYRDGWISRREFIRRAVIIGVSTAAAASMAQTVIPARAAPVAARQASRFSVADRDPRVRSKMISYRSTDGKALMAYMAWSAEAAMDSSQPGIAISPRNQGLHPHHMDVARRFAVQGYVAIAPDQITRNGPPAIELSEDARRAAYAALDSEQTARDMLAALDVLKAHPAVDSAKLAATGYCAGGSVIWRLATLAPDLTAAAPFYGTNPPIAEVPNIHAAMLGVYADRDERVNAGIPEIREAMDAAGTTYAINVYPESVHGFHDDSEDTFNPATAHQAYIDTLNWFAQHLNLAPPRI